MLSMVVGLLGRFGVRICALHSGFEQTLLKTFGRFF
jgi:hypothetical protein